MNKTVVVMVVVLGLAHGVRAADPPRLIKALNLGAINTAANEDDPFLASNGTALYYASDAAGKYDIMVAKRRTATAPWGKGAMLEDYVKTEVDDRSCSLTKEGTYPQYLYFGTRKDKEQKNFDIYVAVKQGANKVFTEPTPVNSVDSDADELYPWLTADGKQLYFSRKTKEGWRVYVSRRSAATGGQGFDEPQLLEDLPPDFHHVTLTRDGKTMYLQGPLGKDRVGLFVASKTAKGWTRPEPLSMLNHPDAPTGDFSPALNYDNSFLYFASDRPEGKGGLDIWAVPTVQLILKK
jgi:hypothetical protein